ncbi:MAG: efflux RND transporter periplasmic adaptor subunit [Fidelibacterota bacterium]|nr:MAG: efflux RND transporter periplasmic adaptor subunit [Candidatus Neomarinimicrobiota bacterium]
MTLKNLLQYTRESIRWLKGLPYQVWILVGVAFLVGILIRGSGRAAPDKAAIAEVATVGEVESWTCSMHPQIKLPKSGQCPICFMDLIPLETSGGDVGPRELQMSSTAAALAGIQTQPVRRAAAKSEVRLSGKVEYDESRLGYITAWVPGRLERLYVDYTGISVNRGDHMVELYSPELYAAQEELSQALRRAPTEEQTLGRESALATIRAAREKLRLMGLTDDQVQAIEKRGIPSDRLTIYSPISGVVIHKNAVEGLYVSTGTKIYTLADLSRVWIVLDAYESDLPRLRFGQDVDFTIEALPGQQFHGRIAFIQPVLDVATRTAKVRLSISNPSGVLKPGMFVRAVVQSLMDAEGQAINPAMAGKWVSPMHPEIVKDRPGKCDVCGMDLVRAEDLGIVNVPDEGELPLVIPASAVLLTGKRAVVYVKKSGARDPVFEGREVILGTRTGDTYVVLKGLHEGEEVVVNGNFKIDSAMQIAAKPSMMNPHGGVVMMAHAGHSMEGMQPVPSPSTQAVPDQGAVMPESMRMETNYDFLLVLGGLYDVYFRAQAALAGDNQEDAIAALVDLREKAHAVNGSRVGLGDHAAQMWLEYQQALLAGTEHAHHWTSIEAARKGFDVVSRVIISLERSFGHSGDQTFYEIVCSMAFGNTGASWFQTNELVNNPYFGARMLRCGEVKAVIPPREVSRESGK